MFNLNLRHKIKGSYMNGLLQVGLLALALIVGSLLAYKLTQPAEAHSGSHDFNIIISAGGADNTISAATDYPGSETQTWEYVVIPADSPCTYHQSIDGSHNYFAHNYDGTTQFYQQANLTEHSYTPGVDLPIPGGGFQGSKYCFGVALEHPDDTLLYEAISIPLGKLTTSVDSVARTISAITGGPDSGLFIYDIIPAASQCGIETDLSNAKLYTNGQALAYTAAQAGQKACFRAVIGGGGLVPGYWYGSAIIPVTAGFAVDVSQGSASLTFKAVDIHDDINVPTDWSYVKLADGVSCDSTAFSGSQVVYSEGTDVAYTSLDAAKRICFRATLVEDGNDVSYAYGLSPLIEAPRVVSILALNSPKQDTNIMTRASWVTIRVTFDANVVLVGDIELVLNTGRRVRLEAVHADVKPDSVQPAGSRVGNSFDFIYQPRVGEYTPGQDTPDDLSDDDLLEVSELSLAAEASLTGDGLALAANLALDGLEFRQAFRTEIAASQNAVDLPYAPHSLFDVYVDARVPTLTITNPDIVAPNPVATYTGTVVSSITVTDEFDTDPAISYLLTSTNGHCNESTPLIGTFTDYTTTTGNIDFTDQKLCMRTEDQAGNVGYKFLAGTLKTIVGNRNRIISVVDDFTDNDNPTSLTGLDENGFHEGFGTYLFEYYFIPAGWVTENDLVGEPGSRDLDYNCRWNIFNGRQIPLAERYPYQEDSQLTIALKNYNAHYVCFRSRRHNPDVYWASDQTDFGAIVSDQITGLAGQSIVSIEDDQTGHSDISLDYGDELKIQVGFKTPVFFTDNVVDQLSLTLSNGQTATYESNSNNLLVFSYTVGAGRDDTTEPLTVTSFNNPGEEVLVDPSLPVGSNLADNDTYHIVRSKPQIRIIYALPTNDGTVRLGRTAEVNITVTVPESLTIDLNGQDPADAIWFETNTHSRAEYVSYSDFYQEMTFKYTVGPLDQTGQLQLLSINFESGVTVTSTASGADLSKTIPAGSEALQSSIPVNGLLHDIEIAPGFDQHTYVANDNDNDLNTWHYVFIATTADCDETAFTSTINSYTPPEAVSYADHTDEQLCFRSADDNDFGEDNVVYAAKNNLDAEVPVITVHPVVSYKTRATIDDSLADFEVQIIADGVACDQTLTTGFEAYDPDHSVRRQVTLENDSKACFRADDQANDNDHSNVVYAASATLSDHTAPEITLTDRPNNKVAFSWRDTPPGQPSIAQADNPHDHRPALHYQRQSQAAINCNATAENIGWNSVFRGNDRKPHIVVYLDQILCFRASDALGNTSYQASSPGVEINEPSITVKPGSAENTFAAHDDVELTPTTWLYRFIALVDGCDESSFFELDSNNNPVRLAGVVDYTEGDDVPYTKRADRQVVCFRSSISSDLIGYKVSPRIELDNSAPRLTELVLVGSHNLLAIGDVLQIRLATSEAVRLDISQGSPSLSLDTGAQASFNPTLTGSGLVTSLVFDYTVSRGQESEALQITSFNLNGAVIEDSADNSLDTSLANTDYLNTYIVVDGLPPRVTLQAGSQPRSYQVSDSDADNGDYQVTHLYVWLPADSDCDSTVDFSPRYFDRKGQYVSGVAYYYDSLEEIRYSYENNDQRLCVQSVDNFGQGNAVYSQTGVVDLPLPLDPVRLLTITVLDQGDNRFSAAFYDGTQNPNESSQVRVGSAQVECQARIEGNPYGLYNDFGLPVIEIEAQQRVCFRARDTGYR